MKIQKPVISQPTITNAGSLTGAGANLTGSFSGAMDISSFDGNAATTISGSLGANATLIRSLTATTVSGSLGANGTLIRSLTATGVSGSLGANATLIRSLTATGVSGSLGANGTLIRSLTAATVSGSNNATSASLAARHVTAEAFKTSFDAAVGLSSDDVTILGNLTVQGTQTSLDTATLNVADLNITVASGSADSAAADGAGLTVDGASATFTYSHSGTKWNMNKALDMGANTITTSGAIAGATLNTGQGANELYAMDQAVQTSDDVQFNDVQIDSIGIGTAASGTSGEIRATGDITAFYSSDERLKENFVILDGALGKVNQMNGYEFDWKDGIEEFVSKKGHDIGVKAQEVQALYLSLIHI